jgi:hypothetical protein
MSEDAEDSRPSRRVPPLRPARTKRRRPVAVTRGVRGRSWSRRRRACRRRAGSRTCFGGVESDGRADVGDEGGGDVAGRTSSSHVTTPVSRSISHAPNWAMRLARRQRAARRTSSCWLRTRSLTSRRITRTRRSPVARTNRRPVTSTQRVAPSTCRVDTVKAGIVSPSRARDNIAYEVPRSCGARIPMSPSFRPVKVAAGKPKRSREASLTSRKRPCSSSTITRSGRARTSSA